MDKTAVERNESEIGDLVPFDKWLKSIGRGRVTGWHWRKGGAVKAINVFGRVYITRAEKRTIQNSGVFAMKRFDASPSFAPRMD
jgi:hypothetical protein